VIVDTFRRRTDRHLFINEMLEKGQPLASCPITLTEVYAGMRPHEEKTTRAFLSSLVFLPITEDIAKRAGRLKAHYARRGTTISFQDACIAAVCIAYDCPLATENTRDFPMPGIQLYPLSSKA
jgi:predicted nucleic acid-binding protein